MSNFLPDTGGQRWSLVYVACSVSLRGGRGAAGRYRWLVCVGSSHSVLATLGLPRSQVCAIPIYTAQAPGCCIWSGPCVACGSSFRVFHKRVDLVGHEFCAFPGLSTSGSQELDGHTLPGCGALSPLHGPSLSFHTCQSGVCALCLFLEAGL